jgi:nucleoside-diphosphate-sugar epimerase
MVFITGGTGLLGTHLILALHKRKVPVRALYRSVIPDIIADKAEWIKVTCLTFHRSKKHWKELQRFTMLAVLYLLIKKTGKHYTG